MLHTLFLLLLAVPGTFGAFKFINPPPFEKTLDFSLNPIYPEGSILNIKWSDQTEENTSLTLWQLNGTQFMEPFEYLTQDVSGSVTSLNWKVQTTKDLSFSNMFYLSIFSEGTTSPLANSHYFNITNTKKDDEKDDESEHESSSSSSKSATTTATTTTGSGPFITAAPTRAPSGSAPTPEVKNEHDEPPPPDTPKDPEGMSTGAKAGIAVGASVGGLILIGVAWFIFRRRRRASASAATCNHLYEGEKYAQNPTPEHRRLSHPVELSGRPRAAPPTIFELPANSSL